MKTILFLLCLLVIMNSNIRNLSGQQVEKLDANCSILHLGNGGGNLVYGGGSGQINLNPGLQYEIDRISIYVGLIVDNSSNPNLYAFPKNEQFDLRVFLRARLGYVVAGVDTYTKTLFSNMLYATSDGIDYNPVYCEPFVFQTDTNKDGLQNVLFLDFADAGSTVISIDSMPIPPVSLIRGINFYGTISFDGVSYTIPDATLLKKAAREKSGLLNGPK